MNRLEYTFFTFLIAFGMTGCSGCFDDTGVDSGNGKGKTVVTFGAVLPLTGDVANWGEESSQGIDLAIAESNRVSAKYEFRVIYQDSKGNATEAVAGTRKLIDVDNVLAIIGDNVSGPTVALVPIADSARVPVISPSASSPKLSGMSVWFFRVYPSDTAEGAFMATVARERLTLETIGILYVNNDFGVGLQQVFSSSFQKGGGKVVDLLGYNEDETDFRPYLTKLKAHAPDAIYLAGYYKDGGAILRQSWELGIDAQFLGSTTHKDPELLEIAKQAAEGFVLPVSTGYSPESASGASLRFRESFHKKYDHDPGLVTALGYDCAKLLTEAVEKKGPSRDGIRAFFDSVRDYEGATGTMTFDEYGDVQKPISLEVVRDGKFVSWTNE